MITLTLSVVNVADLISAGFTHIQLLKSSTRTSAGPYAQVGANIALQGGVTSYTVIDGLGDFGDWYETQYWASGSNSTSSPSLPQPGYLSDLLATVRDLLGVTTNEVTDAQIQGYSYLPAALARVRQRVSGFDAVVSAGGDLSSVALSALAHLLGAMLCPRMTMQIMDLEQFAQYKYQRNRNLDWSATQATLMATYEILIGQAAGEVATLEDAYIPGMLLAGPTRGGYDTSGQLVPFDPPGGVGTMSPYDPGSTQD